MRKYIALFRGINVGGRNKLPMRELTEVLETVGLDAVKTYIQSGNVVFQTHQSNLAELAEQITAAIEISHGFAPKILILSSRELEEAIAVNPFPEAEEHPKTLHLFFLDEEPHAPDFERLEQRKRASEGFELIGKVFYLHAPDGIGRSKLASQVEKAMGVTVTARNWRSVCKISEMAN
jgi:uncharacterized protein (DUF1697 family)